jgi:hypothetical protein
MTRFLAILNMSAALLVALLVRSAGASPCDIMEANGTASVFSCHGQTLIGAGGGNDPTPNTGQVMGECQSLPYTVPPGKTLIVSSMEIEGSGGGNGMYLFTDLANITRTAMTSIETQESPMPPAPPQFQQSVQFRVDWWFPAGTTIHVGFGGPIPGAISGWSFGGCLH